MKELTVEATIENIAAVTEFVDGELEEYIGARLGGVETLTLDCAGLEYISSAGLRVLLRTQKKMNACGTMKLINVSPTVMEIFEITGFSEILTIE